MAKKNTQVLIGRDAQQRMLKQAEASGQPELIAVYGRRRVGKTYLVRQYFAGRLRFELTGTRDASLAEQLGNFTHALGKLTGFHHATPASWQQAFQELEHALAPMLKRKGRHVLFFDELPWLARRNSRFLPAFEQFWNHWASKQPSLIVVVCGSAASWMIAKVLRQRGGLHNRVTRRIRLQPFCLAETEAYLEHLGIRWGREAIVEAYMALGGVPFYLNQISRRHSPAQAIDQITMGPDAPLRHEFEELYAALFEHHDTHLLVVRILAKSKSGLTRKTLINESGMPSGGGLTRVLDELEASGFIERMAPLGRQQRDVIYRLMDEFTLFHLRWGKRRSGWLKLRGKPAWQVWSGYAFENLCIRHAGQMLAALGIAGIDSEITTWRSQGKDGEDDAQIDLLVDRSDQTINLCEMKYTTVPFLISKKVAADHRRKREVFQRKTKTKKTLVTTFVTSAGLKDGGHKDEVVDAEIELGDLFKPL